VAKLRETWKIRDVSISLDDVEGLGKFVEVEVNVDNALEAEDAEGIVNGFLQKLGLDGKPTIRESYLELITKNGVKS
jgi:adenylate cyclase class 2